MWHHRRNDVLARFLVGCVVAHSAVIPGRREGVGDISAAIPPDRLSGARKPGRVLRNLWAPRRLPDASPTPGAALVDVAYVADVAPLSGVGCSSVRYRPHGSERSSARYPLNMPPFSRMSRDLTSYCLSSLAWSNALIAPAADWKGAKPRPGNRVRGSELQQRESGWRDSNPRPLRPER